ncbi:MAG TPA: hypothetical protein PKC97_14635 [Burkholderiaceae bacterium]|nr:hypothetical protein [Burkholderiaceae bacterium]
MKVQLHSIEQAPHQVPDWHLLMDDLCQPPPARVARVLELGQRTIQRYNRTGKAPRAVLLALFWLTRWGRSAVHTQAHNDAVLLAGYVESLRRELDELRSQVEHLRRIGDFGSANEPGTVQPRRLTGSPRHALR